VYAPSACTVVYICGVSILPFYAMFQLPFELFLLSGTFSIFISFQNLALVQLNLIEDLRN
jgi:hypothetical protein